MPSSPRLPNPGFSSCCHSQQHHSPSLRLAFLTKEIQIRRFTLKHDNSALGVRRRQVWRTTRIRPSSIATTCSWYAPHCFLLCCSKTDIVNLSDLLTTLLLFPLNRTNPSYASPTSSSAKTSAPPTSPSKRTPRRSSRCSRTRPRRRSRAGPRSRTCSRASTP